jgi:hypothetical protein
MRARTDSSDAWRCIISGPRQWSDYGFRALQTVQEQAGLFSILVFAPVCDEEKSTWTVEERRQYLEGFILGVMRVGDVVEEVIANMTPQGLPLRVIDQSAHEEQRLLYSRVPRLGVSQPASEPTLSTLLEAGEETVETLRTLQHLGVGLAIDDFGAGYSSLGYLKCLTIDALKIDQSFVRDLVTDPDGRVLAATIVALGHSLGLKVIAEGVETEEQRRLLFEQGCDFAQGYLFSRPLPAEAFVDWLRRPR